MHNAPFVVLEGIDGSGTTTQARLLADALTAVTGEHVVLTREPYDIRLAGVIRDWLRSDEPPHAALLFAFLADREVHLKEVVRPALERGVPVVCDRYVLSTLAYQTEHNSSELVWELALRSQAPSIYVLLDADVRVAAVRVARRGVPADFYEKNVSYQERVAERYLQAAGDRRLGAPVATVNTSSASVGDTAVNVLETVRSTLGI